VLPRDRLAHDAKELLILIRASWHTCTHAALRSVKDGSPSAAAMSSVSLRTTAIWFSRSRAQARALAGEFDAPENS
jgi:hypothetical protein